MKALYLALCLALVGCVSSSKPMPSWGELCALLEVKKESKVFHTFCSAYGAKLGESDPQVPCVPEADRSDIYFFPGGAFVQTFGDDIIYVSVGHPKKLARCIAWPFGIETGDSEEVAASKMGASVMKIGEQNGGHGHRVVWFDNGIAMQIDDGSVASVGMDCARTLGTHRRNFERERNRKANQTLQRTPDTSPVSSAESDSRRR